MNAKVNCTCSDTWTARIDAKGITLTCKCGVLFESERSERPATITMKDGQAVTQKPGEAWEFGVVEVVL